MADEKHTGSKAEKQKDVVINVIRKQLQDQFPIEDKSKLKICEVGDGNINFIYRVQHDAWPNSLIVKLAEPYCRCIGPEYELSTDRVQIEYNSMVHYDGLLPGFTPKPLAINEEKSAFVMEDLHDYNLQRYELMEGRVDKVAIMKLAQNLGRIHNGSHVAALPEHQFKALLDQYGNNGLNDLTRHVVFTDPVTRDKPLNKIADECKKVAENLYDDQDVQTTVQHFQQLFLTKRECLIHGDMHTGSVMVKNGVPKVFDSEFATVGPCMFDLGALIGNYIISYYQHLLTPEDNEAHRRVAYKMLDACNVTVEHYLENMTSYSGDDRQVYVDNLMSELAGFTGIELLRRTLGVAHCADIKDHPEKELEVAEAGVRLVKAYQRINNISMLLNVALMLT